MTCTTVDGISGFNSMVPEVLLTPGVVIPANCSIQQLVNYDCRENIMDIFSSKKTHYKTKSSFDSLMGADISIKTLILCNACQVTSTPSVITPCMGRINPDNLIDQQRLAPTLNIGGLSFTVEAFVKEENGRTRGRNGSKGRSRRKSHHHHHHHGGTPRGTPRDTLRYYPNFSCGDRLISSYGMPPSIQQQCGKEILQNFMLNYKIVFDFFPIECPMECML